MEFLKNYTTSQRDRVDGVGYLHICKESTEKTVRITLTLRQKDKRMKEIGLVEEGIGVVVMQEKEAKKYKQIVSRSVPRDDVPKDILEVLDEGKTVRLLSEKTEREDEFVFKWESKRVFVSKRAGGGK